MGSYKIVSKIQHLYFRLKCAVLYLEELRISEGGCDFPVLGEAAVGVGLADLVHLARQLRQQLHSHHAMLGLALMMQGTNLAHRRN